MFKIAIVEDNQKDVDTLTSYIHKYELEHQVTFDIEIFSDGLQIASNYQSNFDLILLDIQMEHLDGMKTAETIRKFDENVIFIFITSTVQFAVQGYLVDALGYLLKPLPYLAFSQLLLKATKKIQQKYHKEYVTIESDGRLLKLDLNQIYYLESQSHSILIHSERGTFITNGPLKKFEQHLHTKGFSKCHHAYLIHLRHVISTTSNMVSLSNQMNLPISRTKKKTFMDDLTNYIGGLCV